MPNSRILLTALRRLAAFAAYVTASIDARDIFFFFGLASICYGVSLIYQPAAWIVFGLAFIFLGRPQNGDS